MRIVTISHAEAADAAVFANIAKYLLGPEHDTERPRVGRVDFDPLVIAQIAHADRPDVGKEPPKQDPYLEGIANRALPQPPQPPVDQAAIVFAGNSVPPIPGVAPSTAAVAAPVIAAVTSTPPTVPLPPAASPASPAAAPAAPVVPPSPAAGVPKIDTKGIPWDPRIHSRTQALNKDGTWRQKRETDPAFIAQVEAELRQVMGIPAAPAAAPAAAAAPPAPVQPAPFQQPPAVPVPPAAAPAAPARTFGALMEWLEPHMTGGKITQEHIKAAMMGQGVMGSLGALIHRPDVVPAIWDELERLVKA